MVFIEFWIRDHRFDPYSGMDIFGANLNDLDKGDLPAVHFF